MYVVDDLMLLGPDLKWRWMPLLGLNDRSTTPPRRIKIHCLNPFYRLQTEQHRRCFQHSRNLGKVSYQRIIMGRNVDKNVVECHDKFQ